MQLDNSPFEFETMSRESTRGYFQQVAGNDDENVGGMDGTKTQTRERAVSLQDQNREYDWTCRMLLSLIGIGFGHCTEVFRFSVDYTIGTNKIPFPTIRPRSWHEAILATRMRLFNAHEIMPDNNTAMRIQNAQTALERLDGMGGVGEEEDLLKRVYHLK